MTADPKGTTPGPQTPGEDEDRGCRPCDLEEFDGLACRAARYAKQAEIMTKVATDLETYKTQYSEARVAFADAWEALAAERAEIQATLDDIEKLLKCRLTEDQKDCLDEAAEDVFEDVDECAPAPGCCVGECDFDDEVADDDDITTLTARIEKYRRWTEANTACFTSLVGEAAAITAQVATLKAEVTALDADVQSGDDAKLPKWYARWLIASRGLELTHLGHGFTSVAAYSDCVCTTLQCIASGWAAIAVLEGAKAEMMCLEASRTAECERKAGSILESILEAYECCIEDKDTPESPEQGEAPEQGEPESAS
jgi:hypothetical protein